MPAHLPAWEVPPSYEALPYTAIKVLHHPPQSPAATPVVTVLLNRPAQRNAFTRVMADELEHVFGVLSIDDRVKAIVMGGEGSVFCAGMDLNEGFKLDGSTGQAVETEKTHRDEGGRVSLAIHTCTKPVIGAIHGAAVGVGISMTLPMTIRVAWSRAKIGFVFARRGLITEAASSFFLPRLVGHGRALHAVTTGDVYPASDKIFDGLFTELVPDQAAVLPRAQQLAVSIAQNTSTVANFLSRELMWRGQASAEETHLLDSRLMFGLRGGVDNDEGVNSFLEKRAAVFRGTVQKDAYSLAAYPWFARVDRRLRPGDEGWDQRGKL